MGTTTVTCTASSADDVVAAVTSSFTVTVQGTSAQLVALTQAVQGVGPGTSLSGKLAQVQAYVAAGDITDACGTLGAFIHEVTSLSGRSITTAAAAQLIADAQRIEATLSC